MGEKTGWTYIEVPADLAQQLKPGNKKSFRVKGLLDQYPIAGVALIPMGEGNFIMSLNAEIRKGIGKRKGATLKVKLEVDERPQQINSELMDCLSDEPRALDFFNSLPQSHRVYFSKWIESAKTDATKAKRITMAVNALARSLPYNLMIREAKANKGD